MPVAVVILPRPLSIRSAQLKNALLRRGSFPFGDVGRYFVFAAACTVVEVDVLTGELQILSTDLVYDCGESLNPLVDIGQVCMCAVVLSGFTSLAVMLQLLYLFAGPIKLFCAVPVRVFCDVGTLRSEHARDVVCGVRLFPTSVVCSVVGCCCFVL